MAQDPELLPPSLASASPPDLDLAFRPMPGEPFADTDARRFVSLCDVVLALNFVGSERNAILALPGGEPPGCEPDQPTSKSCVVMPEPMLSEPDELRSWMIRNVPGLTAKSGRKRA